MRNQFYKVLFGLFSILTLAGNSFYALDAAAEDQVVRWTGAEDSDASLTHILSQLSRKRGKHYPALSEKDVLLQEDRDLAFTHYKRWIQVIDQVPVHGSSIRLWTQQNSNQVIQLEANLVNPTKSDLDNLGVIASDLPSSNPSSKKTTSQLRQEMTFEETLSLVRQGVEKYQDDPYFQGVDWKDEWQHNQLTRLVKVKGKRGYHHFRIRLRGKQILSHQYREFPQDDISIPVQIYPIYEEVENGDGTLLPRVPGELKHILREIPQVVGDIYSPLITYPHFDLKFDPILGEMEAGRAKGYWSFSYLKEQAALLRSQLPILVNDWRQGVLLEGRYATINIHPDAIEKYKPLNFKPVHSSALFLTWAQANYEGKPAQLMTPTNSAYSGQRLSSPIEAWYRPANRLPNHDPVQYMNDGFDELQVYYAIDTLFEVLHARGFSDPELSTRPFNAFLFNPDIAYRDNAFYTDDTINFTTYSPKAGNAARDNSTIWHELGHGLMDRLMGNNIELADTGGLSEGMADFIAAMVVQAVTQGVPFPGSDEFRIINQTGFYLTNEVHDDGQAYGGAMKDFLDAVIQVKGPVIGLKQVMDVVLEAMRLTRDYPGLTAPEWFKHILFADSLGRLGLRQPGELAPFLLKSLAGRNFKIGGGQVASFSLINLTSPTHPPGLPSTPPKGEVDSGSPGSREYPIRLSLKESETASFQLQASLKSSDEFKFHYPAEVRVRYQGSPLQGAIHWVGKENGPQSYILNQESDQVILPLKVTGACDEVNRSDGSCVDYADVLIFDGAGSENPATKKPVAKKRFYLRISTRKDKARRPKETHGAT